MKKKGLIAISIGFLLVPLLANAQAIADVASNVLSDVRSDTGVADVDVATAGGEAIQAALSLVGLFFLMLMVYAGLRWMMARGEEENIKKAQKTVIAATVGLVVSVSGYAFTVFILGGIINPQQTITEGPIDPNEPMGCCFLRTAAEGSTGESGASFDQVGFTYDNWWIDVEPSCSGHQIPDGVVAVIGPTWIELASGTPDMHEAWCQELVDAEFEQIL